MNLPTDLPGCGEPAIVVFEIFTRTETGYSLDGRLNVCVEHVAPAIQGLHDAGFEPHKATQEPGRCGDGFDYVARTALAAPVATTADPRREALERNLAIAEASGYTYVADNNRRLLARLDEQKGVHSMDPLAAPTATERARALRQLVWSWLPEEPDEVFSGEHLEPTASYDAVAEVPTAAEQRAKALALLEQVRDAQQFLASWTDRLIRIAADNDATNPAIGAALGVGKERIRRRLLKEPA
jgi:hypothetical protein